MSQRPNLRNGLTRYGLATVIAAAPAARASDGNVEVPFADPMLSRRSGTAPSTIRPTSATPATVRATPAAQSRSSDQRCRTRASTPMTTTQICKKSNAGRQTMSRIPGNAVNQPANAVSAAPGSFDLGAGEGDDDDRQREQDDVGRPPESLTTSTAPRRPVRRVDGLRARTPERGGEGTPRCLCVARRPRSEEVTQTVCRCRRSNRVDCTCSRRHVRWRGMRAACRAAHRLDCPSR